MLRKRINNKLTAIISAGLLSISLLFSCTEMVEVDPPNDRIITESTFSNGKTATAAVYGMYRPMMDMVVGFSSNLSLTDISALYSDEIILTSINDGLQEIYSNAVRPENRTFNSSYWGNGYRGIYYANAVIEGIEQYGHNIPRELRDQFIGEAKFVRAWYHFVLVEIYGDVPVILTMDYNTNRLVSRSERPVVYKQIVADLLSAKDLLKEDYLDKNNMPSNERVRATKDVARFFLSKVYLYLDDWQNAESMASEVLDKTATYSLNDNLVGAFHKGSNETILQVFEENWFANRRYDLSTSAPMGINTINNIGYLSDSVMNKYEDGDKRRTDWIGERISGSNIWYYPVKRKGVTSDGNLTVAMRLAELYLIRAEARIQQNKIAEGIEDLNVLRGRARAEATPEVLDPLPDLPITLNKNEAMLALEKEWTTEMFMEGHRWFNLKRWKGINDPALTRADELMPAIVAAKMGEPWQSYKMIFPVPADEIELNPNMVQTQGY